MVFLLRFKKCGENTDPGGEMYSPLGLRNELLSTEVDRSCYQKLNDLGVGDHTDFVLQHYGS